MKTWGFLVTMNWPVAPILFVLSLFAPIAPLVHLIVLFLLIDMITSIYYQYKVKVKGCDMHYGLKVLTLFKTFWSGS